MRKASFLPLLLLSIVTASGQLSETGSAREFTSSDGLKITATLLSVSDSKVTIKRASDGRTFTLPLERLSAEDQAFVAAAGSAGGGDWHQWRGPNRDGVSTETGLNRDWEKKTPELAWRTKGLGKGMASIAISGGKIYTVGEGGEGFTMHCRELADGAEVWKTKLPGSGDPNCTPTIDPASGLGFALSKNGELSAVKLADGSVVWSKSYAGDFGGKMMSGWGYSESPLVDGDLLLCTPGAQDGMIAALKKETGEVVWKTDVSGADLGGAGKDGAGYGSIVISNGGGVKQYVQLVGRGLIGVSAEDGKLLWNYNRIANGTANIPTPVISGDLVFGSTGYSDGGTALLELKKTNSGVSASEKYYLPGKDVQNHHGGMILVGDYVYLGDGHNNGFPQCVDLKSGKLKWDKERGAGKESAAILYADGLLFFRYQDHTMALIEADPSGYKPLGSFKIDSKNGKSWPHPVIQGGKLYLRDQDELLCYDVSA